MKAKSATSGGAPWRMIQSRKSSSLSARKPRGSVVTPSASRPRTTVVITATRCQVRRTSGSGSRSAPVDGRQRAVERGHRAPRGPADALASTIAASTVMRTPVSSGRAREPLSVTSPSGSEARKSTISPQRAPQQLGQREGRRLGLAGQLVVGGELAEPVVPAVRAAILEPDGPGRQQRLAPRPDRRLRVGRRAVELLVALAQQPEGVLVVAEPEVQAVLLDAAVHAAAARALAAEPPAALVDGDRLDLLLPARLAQPPGGRQPGHAAAEDGDAPDHRVRSRSRSIRSSNGRAPWRTRELERGLQRRPRIVVQRGEPAQRLGVVEAHARSRRRARATARSARAPPPARRRPRAARRWSSGRRAGRSAARAPPRPRG